MPKHDLSPAPMPPAKRLHTLETSKMEPRHILTFENSIYDELVLCVFAHLSWMDLCVAQTINKKWARLSADNELWRREYLRVFGRTRLRGGRGLVGRSDGRETKPLPGRASAEEVKDWKWMFRISSNWLRGRCKAEGLLALAPAIPGTDRLLGSYHPIVLVAGRLTITASSRPATRPEIQVTGYGDHAQLVIKCESQLANTSHITALAVDQSPPHAGCLRLASFLSTGEFIIWSLTHSQPVTYTRQYSYQPSGRAERTAPIIEAVYHHPLLVTLSQSFSLSIYDLSSSIVRHSQTLTSFTSFPPTSLVLSTLSPASYKLVLAYAIPVYPAHWSVGATELIIGGTGSSSKNSATSALSFSSDTPSSGPEALTIRSTRTIRTIDVPRGWVDERKLRAMREQWGRKVSQVMDTQTDGKWVVLAPGDRLSSYAGYSPPQEHSSPSSAPPFPVSAAMMSSPMHSALGLQLYRLTLPPQSSSVSASPPKLTFVRTLHGQMGPIASLALADGRCVSLGHNGSIWVWDLENGTGAEVAAGDFPAIDAHPEPVRGAVVFDEKRIISALAGNVVVRRFDI
ncbi:hypothetical protein D9611_003946 [Ephemerocybe angulata]|uniref:F-box domain-containing protein n=1 Tax=Ephemerocybe angulata TaxID=980116 RepID=A0A8H5B5A9_9AGAR|nr:hypothetical protein D9611_003946 [Tulosesus angulatus]